MIPTVIMNWCLREAKCKWCEQPIVAGQPMVTVFFWNKGAEGRKWNVKQYYHVNNEGQHCWELNGLDYLKRNPYVPYIRKPTSLLSREDRRTRLLILKRKARLNQEIRELDKSKSNYPERLQTMELKLATLILEIMPYGGIPKSWAEELVK